MISPRQHRVRAEGAGEGLRKPRQAGREVRVRVRRRQSKGRNGGEGGGLRTHSCHGSMLPFLSIMSMAAESWTVVMTRWRPLRSPLVIAAFLATSPTGMAGVRAEAWLSSANRKATCGPELAWCDPLRASAMIFCGQNASRDAAETNRF